MQIFFKQMFHKYSCAIKDNFKRFKTFFILQLIILIVAGFLGVLICLKNANNCCLDRLYDKSLYNLLCGHINFFQYFLKKTIEYLFLFSLLVICFCNKKCCYISFIITFYFVFKVFFDIAILVRCLGFVGLLFAFVSVMLFVLLVLCSLFVAEMILLVKVHNQCNDFCFNFDFKMLLTIFLFIVILLFIQSLTMLIFFPFINAFV